MPRPRLRAFETGDLIVQIDGLDMTSEREALALLDDPRPHRAVLRGPHQTKIVSCPPAPAGMVLPLHQGFDRPNMGTTPALVVGELGSDNPWQDCLRPGDLLTAVMTDPHVIRSVNAQWRVPLDAALASGRPERLEVRRRGPPRVVHIPVAR